MTTDQPKQPLLSDFAAASTDAVQEMITRGKLAVVSTHAAVIQAAADIGPSVNDTRMFVQQAKYAVPALAITCMDPKGARQTFYVLEEAAQDALQKSGGASLFRAVEVVQANAPLVPSVVGKSGLDKAMGALGNFLTRTKEVMSFDEKLLKGIQKTTGLDVYLPADYMRYVNQPALKKTFEFLGHGATVLKVASYTRAAADIVTEGNICKTGEVTGSLVGGAFAASAASTALVTVASVGTPVGWFGRACCVALPYIAGCAGAIFGDKVGGRVAQFAQEKLVDKVVGRQSAMHALQQSQDTRFHAMLLGGSVKVFEGMNPLSMQDSETWLAEHANTRDAKQVAAQVKLIRDHYRGADFLFGQLKDMPNCAAALQTPASVPNIAKHSPTPHRAAGG